MSRGVVTAKVLLRVVLPAAALLGFAATGMGSEDRGDWFRLGRGKKEPAAAPAVVSLDRYLPHYDVSERHETRVKAPAPITYAAARSVDIQRSPLVRAVFQSRKLILRDSGPDMERRPFLDQVRGMGWSLLAEVPGRAMVFGAVTRPWEAKVKFHPLPPAQFVAFRRPGWAKIIWTLEVDPAGASRSVFRTQTRVATTDVKARKRFRTYWTQFSPGIVLVRQQALGLVKGDAERKARASTRGRR